MHIFNFPRSDARNALRDYLRCGKALVNATPTPESAQRAFETAKIHLIEVLIDSDIATPLSKKLSDINLDSSGIEAIENFISFEIISVCSILSITGTCCANVMQDGISSFDAENIPTSAADAIDLVNKFHDQFLKSAKTSRTLNKNEKRKRKKQIISALIYMTVGLAAVLGNLFVFSGDRYQTASVGGGAGAFVKGACDLFVAV